jgi:tRNA A37 threonylcarbamoyladenosine dehydratase
MDYTRQASQLNPDCIKQKKATIIGVGATGSFVAYMLAKSGWGDCNSDHGILSVWDGDVVEDHNLCNQIYEPQHVGMKKVDALNAVIKRGCGFDIDTHAEMVVDQSDIRSSKYVFLLTDTMKSRAEIFDKCLRHSFNTDLVIETRMGIDEGRVYAFNPNDQDQVEAWDKTLYSDDVAVESACGSKTSVGATAMFIASMAVWKLIHHFDMRYGDNNTQKRGRGEDIINEVIFSLGYDSMYTRQFGRDAE